MLESERLWLANIRLYWWAMCCSFLRHVLKLSFLHIWFFFRAFCLGLLLDVLFSFTALICVHSAHVGCIIWISIAKSLVKVPCNIQTFHPLLHIWPLNLQLRHSRVVAYLWYTNNHSVLRLLFLKFKVWFLHLNCNFCLLFKCRCHLFNWFTHVFEVFDIVIWQFRLLNFCHLPRGLSFVLEHWKVRNLDSSDDA